MVFEVIFREMTVSAVFVLEKKTQPTEEWESRYFNFLERAKSTKWANFGAKIEQNGTSFGEVPFFEN